MNKTLKKVLIVLAILAVVAVIVVGIVLHNHNAKYISKNEAVDIALKDSNVASNEIVKTEAEFEKTKYSAWYEVEIETHTTEYDYDIDAVTGDILSSNQKPAD